MNRMLPQTANPYRTQNGNGGNGNGGCAPCDLTRQVHQQAAMAAARAAAQQPQTGQIISTPPGALINPIPWIGPGTCPESLARLLCYLEKSTCSFNQFGQPSAVKLRTDPITLPDPTFDFRVGPGAGAQSFGTFWPRTWAGEAMFHAIHRLKLSFDATVTLGALTPEQIIRSAFDSLLFRVIQVGSHDPFVPVVTLEAADLERSTDSPAFGGYYFPQNGELVPFILAPELFAYDLSGELTGVVGTDAYTLRANITTYWKQIC